MYINIHHLPYKCNKLVVVLVKLPPAEKGDLVVENY